MKKIYNSQLKIIKILREAIENDINYIIDSPTGTGKTLAVLYSIAPYIDLSYEDNEQIKTFLSSDESSDSNFSMFGAEKESYKVYYISRTHSQLNQVSKELSSTGIKCNSVVLGNRSLYCNVYEGEIEELNEICTTENCSFKQNQKNVCVGNKSKEVKKIAGLKNLIQQVKQLKIQKDLNNKKEGELFFNFNSENLLDLSIKNEHLHEKINFRENQKVDREEVEENVKFCPYYFSGLFSAQSNVVFTTYKTILSKQLRKINNINLSNSIVIFDEAHNLYDMLSDTYSAEVSIFSIKKVLKSFLKFEHDTLKIIKKTFENILEYSKKISLEYSNKISGSLENNEFCIDVNKFLIETRLYELNFIEISENIEKTKILLKIGIEPVTSYDIKNFIYLLTQSDKNMKVIFTFDQSKLLRIIKITPMNPRIYFEEFKRCKNVIMIGGTMKPIELYKFILPESKFFSVETQIKNFNCFVIKRYKNQDIQFKHKTKDFIINNIVDIIESIHKNTKGGSVVFVASKKILEMFKNLYVSEKTFFDDFEGYKKEIDIMSYKENSSEDFCSELMMSSDKILQFDCAQNSIKEKEDKWPILFSVLSGKLSEGINFSDNLCRSLVIVGVPFPSFSVEMTERDIYFEENVGQKYSILKAFDSVNQAIGRSLRHKDDFSDIYLIDSRYEKYKELVIPWVQAKMEFKSFEQINFNNKKDI